MPAKVKINKSFYEKKERLKKMPTIGKNVLYGMRKKDAGEFIKIFHDGIKNRTFGLEKLKPSTVKTKKKLGYQSPYTPLYGKGDQEKMKSYVNMLRIKKMKNGWKLFPSWGKHHKSSKKLRELLDIHETGRTFMRGKTLVRIPPRPAFRITTEKFLKKFKSEKTNKIYSKAMAEYINTGKSAFFDEMLDFYYNKYNDIIE